MIFSLEMPRTEVASRLVASGAHVSFQQVIRRKMRQETLDKVKTYTAQNADMKLYITDRAGLTVEQIAAHCRTIKDLDMVVIDYAQLVGATDKRAKRNEIVAHVSRTLKVLAKDLHVVVVLAAQMNRQSVDPKTGKARRPTLVDLGESGALEADADTVLFLHRPDEDDGTVDIVIAKNRSGLVGVVPLLFIGHEARLG
jgi:replicative DNA helicase